MMRFLLPVLVAALAACSGGNSPGAPEQDSISADSSKPEDSTKVISGPDPLETFLEHPFSEYEWMVKKGSANSSVLSQAESSHFFHPDSQGVFVRYFLFQPHSIGNRKDWTPEQITLTRFQFGNGQNFYLTQNAVMVEFTAKVNDLDLPGLDFIGRDQAGMEKQLGPATTSRDNLLIWVRSQKALVARMMESRVAWWKWMNLNSIPQTGDSIPAYLKEYGERFGKPSN